MVSIQIVMSKNAKPTMIAAIANVRIARQKTATNTTAMRKRTRTGFWLCGAEASASMIAPIVSPVRQVSHGGGLSLGHPFGTAM